MIDGDILQNIEELVSIDKSKTKISIAQTQIIVKIKSAQPQNARMKIIF